MVLKFPNLGRKRETPFLPPKNLGLGNWPLGRGKKQESFLKLGGLPRDPLLYPPLRFKNPPPREDLPKKKMGKREFKRRGEPQYMGYPEGGPQRAQKMLNGEIYSPGREST